MPTNPYAAIALKDEENPYAKIAITPAQNAGAGGAPTKPSLITDLVKGIGESAVSLMSTGDNAVRKIPGIGEWLTTPATGAPADKAIAHTHELATPANTTQAVGKGIGDAAQFLIPGGAEEKAAMMLPEIARPAARIGLSALSSGAVNKAQGGSFGTGAAAGGIGAGIGAGLKAAAPKVAETALGIPKAARAFGKTPGAAILNETRGIRPETIADSAKESMGKITPQLEHAADVASVRPNPTRGLLTSGTQEIPLGSAPNVRGRLSKPITLQSNRPMPREFPGYGVNAPPTPRISEGVPGEAGEIPTAEQMSGQIPRKFNGFGPHEYQGEIPGSRGGIGQPNGVLLRPPSTSGSPIPSIIPNRSASLGPARSIIGDAMNQAERQNAEGLHSQLGNMQQFLGKRFGTNEPIPANVTPRELLDLKRGLSEEHLRWNPETHNRALSTGRSAYHALDQELDRTVPEAAGLNQRLSSLIPVAQRGESVSRNAPTLQRAIGRFGAHTGALTLGGVGAVEGHREAGVPGAIAGGLTGVLAPELISSPEGQMAIARTLNKARNLRPVVGGALQLTRGGNQ